MEKLKNILKNKELLTIFLSGVVFLIVFILSPLLIFIDKSITYEFLSFKNHMIESLVSDELVIVEIDNKTLNKIGTYPLSREVYTQSIRNLNEAGVSIIALDIIFGEAGIIQEIDNELALEMKNSGNVIIGGAILDTDNEFLNLPYEKFRKEVLGFGYFNPKITKKTNEVYSFYPVLNLRTNSVIEIDGKKVLDNKEKQFNYFPIEILKNYFNTDSVTVNNIGVSLDDYINIPFSSLNSGEVLINFLPRQKFIQKISLSDIYFKDDRFKEIDFEDKIILVGATADGIKDTFNTPNGIDYGVYIHGNALNTILTGKYLIYFNKTLEWLLIALLIVVAIYSHLSKNNIFILFSTIGIVAIFILLPLALIFLSNLVLNNPASIFLAFILSLTVSNIVKYLIENKDKKKVIRAIGEYISKDIARKILETNEGVKLEGEKKEISMFFSDISGFTTISEQFSATELVDFLREYLGEMSHIIMDQNGFINKYEGDAIMALFGVFSNEESSNYDNCKSALLQQKSLDKLNSLWQEKYNRTLRVRMGLHFGEAIIGNIGAIGKKMEYTALGDNVNLASRLEGVNKFYGTKISVSEAIYQDQKDNFEFRKLDKIRVKGKSEAVVIYELLGFRGEISDLKIDMRNGFEKALELYSNNKFKEASEIFRKLGDLGDKPSFVFLRRCLKFEITPPKPDWGGVWNLDEK